MSSSRSASASGKAGREGLGRWRPDVAGHAREDHECGADCTGPFSMALILKCITFILRRPTSKSAEVGANTGLCITQRTRGLMPERVRLERIRSLT